MGTMSAVENAAVVASRRRAAEPRAVIWGAASLLSALAALADASIAAGAPWRVCGGDGQGPLGSQGLLMGQVIASIVVQAALWALAYRLITALVRPRVVRLVCVAVAAIGLLLLVSWGFLGLLGLPVSYAGHVGTYPHWWPDWLPPGARILPCRPAE